MPDPGLQQEAEEAAARIGILRHDGRYPDFFAGYVAAAESRDQRIRRLAKVAKAGRALMGAEVEVHNSGGELGALGFTLDGLQPGDLDADHAGAEADPDVAETAWAIIDHHREHRTAG